jgi:hypothetical protein
VSFGQVGPDAGLSGSTTVFEHWTVGVLTFPGGLSQSTARFSIKSTAVLLNRLIRFPPKHFMHSGGKVLKIKETF